MGTKLSSRGHLSRQCRCASCIGSRNKKKGQRAEMRAHRRLGGKGQTIRDDVYYPYELRPISLETKTGEQVPASFTTFIGDAWFQEALRQAIKKMPVGEGAYPSVMIELDQSTAYLVTDVSGRVPKEGLR